MSTIKKDSGFGVAQIILLISIAVLVIFVAWPVLLILFNAFFVDGTFNSSDFYAVLTEPETFQALKNSLIIASMTTIGSTIVGTFFAWLVTRTDLPYKTFMKSLFLVPFMLPSFIGALAWKMLLSPNSGYINTFFMETFGLTEPVFNIYSYFGISLVEVMYLFPFVFIQVCGALERMDPTLEESARISGAGLFTITRKITIPLVLPSIMSGALLIMLYSMAHFGTVAVLGIEQGIYNIPTLIYEKIHQSGGAAGRPPQGRGGHRPAFSCSGCAPERRQLRFYPYRYGTCNGACCNGCAYHLGTAESFEPRPLSDYRR